MSFANARSLTSGLAFDPTDTSLPHGLRRFGAQLARLGAAFDAATAAGPGTRPDRMHGHALYATGARTHAFMLQGLARLHAGIGRDTDLFENVRREAKILEDALGEVDFWWTLRREGAVWKLPPAVLAAFGDQHAQACGRVTGWTEARGWVDHRYLPMSGRVRLRAHRISRLLARSDAWRRPRREKRELATVLARRLRHVHAHVGTLDMGSLEEGLHELRRNLRWFSIYAAALDGVLQLDRSAAPPPHWDRYLTPEVVDSPFNVLPAAPPEAVPIRMPAPLHYALSWAIAELGVLKDRAQWTETVGAVLRATGAARGTDAARWLGDTALHPTEACERGAALADRLLRRDALLLRMADAVEAQAE